MKVSELMSKLAEVSKGNPDLEVEINIKANKWPVEAELSEDTKAGETIIVEPEMDEYAEEFSVERTKCGEYDKVCIFVQI